MCVFGFVSGGIRIAKRSFVLGQLYNVTGHPRNLSTGLPIPPDLWGTPLLRCRPENAT
jgi:hypothetical protein